MRKRALAVVLVGLVFGTLLFFWASLAQVRWFEARGPAVTVTGQLELTQAQPAMAVEVEASFVSRSAVDGISGSPRTIHPYGADFVAYEAVGWAHWGGEQWAWGTTAETSGVGLNTFRFRWVVQLRDGFESATVPLEARFDTGWSDGSEAPPPDEADVSDLQLWISSTHLPE